MDGTTAGGGTRARRVLVVGGGFAGLECARRLARSGPGAFDVTLVNPEDYSLYLPLLPDVAGGLLDPRHIAVPDHPGAGRRPADPGHGDLGRPGSAPRPVQVAGRPDGPAVIVWS